MKKQRTVDTSFKPNDMDKVMEIEKPNEFNLLKEVISEVWIVKKRDWFIYLDF